MNYMYFKHFVSLIFKKKKKKTFEAIESEILFYFIFIMRTKHFNYSELR